MIGHMRLMCGSVQPLNQCFRWLAAEYSHCFGLLWLQSNSGVAELLASYHALTGSWRGVLQELEAVEDLAPQDCRRVAEQVFNEGNCFRGYVDAKPASR